MSGFEIAGIVLGTYPILIHALEKYRAGAEKRRDWWRFQGRYQECEEKLQYHRILFEGNVERLLLPLVVEKAEREDLIQNPRSEKWASADLESALKQSLPKAYEAILRIIVGVSQSVESLKVDLGLSNEATKVQIDQHYQLVKGKTARSYRFSLEHFEFQSKRIRFALRRSSRDRLFEQLEELNNQLTNLLQNADAVELARQQSKAVKRTGVAESRSFSALLSHLYEALSKALKPPQCSCAGHIANFQLREDPNPSSAVFNLWFKLNTDSSTDDWIDTRIEARPRERQTRVRIVGGSGNAAAQATTQATTRMPQNQRIPITSLCSSLRLPFTSCIGFLECDDHHFVVFPQAQPSASMNNDLGLTLGAMLSMADKMQFSRTKRYSLALMLSEWFVQLGSTPWLDSPLQRTFVFFQDPLQPGNLTFEHPYVRRDLSEGLQLSLRDVLRNFGTCLLELCFNIPLESTEFYRKMSIGFGTMNLNLEHAAAELWSKEVGKEAGPEFQDAVRWCVYAYNVDQGNWRKDSRTYVIEPLQLCHQSLIC